MISIKCERVILGHKTTAEVTQATELFQEILPDIKTLTDSQALLLGAPVSGASMKPAIESKVQNLRLMKENFTCLEPHQSLTLLKNSFSKRKLQYIPRISSAYIYGDTLHEFDELTRSLLSQIANVRINEKSRSQASLTVSFSGIGLRQAVDVSLLATIELVEARALWHELSGGTKRPTAESSLK